MSNSDERSLEFLFKNFWEFSWKISGIVVENFLNLWKIWRFSVNTFCNFDKTFVQLLKKIVEFPKKIFFSFDGKFVKFWNCCEKFVDEEQKKEKENETRKKKTKKREIKNEKMKRKMKDEKGKREKRKRKIRKRKRKREKKKNIYIYMYSVWEERSLKLLEK